MTAACQNIKWKLFIVPSQILRQPHFPTLYFSYQIRSDQISNCFEQNHINAALRWYTSKCFWSYSSQLQVIRVEITRNKLHRTDLRSTNIAMMDECTESAVLVIRVWLQLTLAVKSNLECLQFELIACLHSQLSELPSCCSYPRLCLSILASDTSLDFLRSASWLTRKFGLSLVTQTVNSFRVDPSNTIQGIK